MYTAIRFDDALDLSKRIFSDAIIINIMNIGRIFSGILIVFIFIFGCTGIEYKTEKPKNLDNVKTIVTKNPSRINEINSDGNSFLHMAVIEGNIRDIHQYNQ